MYELERGRNVRRGAVADLGSRGVCKPEMHFLDFFLGLGVREFGGLVVCTVGGFWGREGGGERRGGFKGGEGGVDSGG